MNKLNIYTKQIVFDTALTRAQTMQIMQDNTETFDFNKFHWSIPKTKKAFLGTNRDDSFYLIRNMQYRNSWRPIITAQIDEDLEGTKLVVNFRVSTSSQIFSYVWLTPLVLLTIYAIISSLFDWQNIFIAVVPIIMGGIELGMSLGGFNYEIKKVVAILKRILNTRQIIDR